MKLSLKRYDLWATVKGGSQELDSLRRLLDNHARELDPQGRGRQVYVTNQDGDLHVLRGWVNYLWRADVLKAPADLVYEDRNRNAMLYRLAEKAGDFLRQSQITAAVELLSAPFNCGTVEMATGTGKTRLCVALMALGSAIGIKSWIYLVQNVELATQTLVAFNVELEELCERLGCTKPEVTCCSYGEAGKLDSKQFDGALVDEAHGLPALTRAASYAGLKVRYRFGMSGSLLKRQDSGNALVIGFLGPVVYRYAVDSAQADQALAQGTVVPVYFQH
jgi:superfamily II DNA or RNA helicase